MSNITINDLPVASTIDGAADWLPIWTNNLSVTQKISRNVLLGVTGQPMDISSSQSVTNKTLNNTNVLTLRDDRFTLQDNGDVTKQAVFQLSGITTATTRTYTLPNASSTLVDISSTQTLTNKTLTSPTITGGSITGSTIITDAIVGQSSATSGTVYGLSIVSGKVGTDGVITASITDTAVTPAKLQAGTGATWVWQSWVPTISNWNIGTGGSAGTMAKYIQVGKTVHFKIISTLGTSGQSVTGGVDFSLPVTASTLFISGTSSQPIGLAWMEDNGVGSAPGMTLLTAITTAAPIAIASNGLFIGNGGFGTTTPFTWGAGDSFYCEGTYEAV